MYWRVRVKIRTYYKGRTPYKVATITLPREIREILEKNGIDYVYIATEPLEEPAENRKNDKYVWALQRLSKFFEYLLIEGPTIIAGRLVGKKEKQAEVAKIIQGTLIEFIENFFGADYEKLEKILAEVVKE